MSVIRGWSPALAAVLAVVLGGCLAGQPSGSPSPTPFALGPSLTPVEYSPKTTVWVDGFVVTVQSATASLDPKGGVVTVLLSILNPGTDDATLDVPILLTSGAKEFALAHGSELPDVPSGGLVDISLAFDVVGQGTIDDGVVRIGRPSDHAAAIPLRPNPLELVTLQPIGATLKKTAGTAGNLHVALHRWTIRWDLPDWHDELALGTEALTVTYDVTNRGSFSGGTAFTAANVQLRLPDGTLLSPRTDGHSQSIVAIGPGKTATGLFSRFEVPNGLSGVVALVVRDGSRQKAIQFRIGP